LLASAFIVSPDPFLRFFPVLSVLTGISFSTLIFLLVRLDAVIWEEGKICPGLAKSLVNFCSFFIG
jgi:hypothetical protein